MFAETDNCLVFEPLKDLQEQVLQFHFGVILLEFRIYSLPCILFLDRP
jgi:hypothetical protein